MRTKSKETLIVFCLFLAVIIAFVTDPMMATASDISDVSAEESHIVEVRTKQFNIYSIPLDSGAMVWRVNFNRNKPRNKITFEFKNPPRAMSEESFAGLDNFAKQFIGVPYIFGGKSPSEGFDCSGFVLYVLSHCGVGLTAAGTKDQYTHCYILPEGQEAPGDIVFFQGTGTDGNPTAISHVGLYLGDGKMIHAGTKGIAIVNLSDAYYTEHFLCFGRPITW